MVQQRLCLACGTPFEVPPTSRRRYCSIACQPHHAHSTRAKPPVTVECDRCGKEFQRKAWEVEQRRRKGWALYCSVECRDAVKRGRKGSQRVERIEFVCPQCGDTFQKAPHEKSQKYCSRPCAHEAMRGVARPTSGKRHLTRDGYISVYVPPGDRPRGKEKIAREMEHRVVMARVLGRALEPYETVHHINGDKVDNRIENLQLRIGSHGYGVALRCRHCGSSDIESVEI